MNISHRPTHFSSLHFVSFPPFLPSLHFSFFPTQGKFHISLFFPPHRSPPLAPPAVSSSIIAGSTPTKPVSPLSPASLQRSPFSALISSNTTGLNITTAHTRRFRLVLKAPPHHPLISLSDPTLSLSHPVGSARSGLHKQLNPKQPTSSSSPAPPSHCSHQSPFSQILSFRSIPQLGALQSLLPLHTAVSSARLTSCLGVDSSGSRSLSQELGLSVPR